MDTPERKPPVAPRVYRKRVELFALLEKIKMWPSRQGILHGIKTIAIMGDLATLTTHCDRTFVVRNSRNSRAARWLRNKWHKEVCATCAIPEWKLQKYSATLFKRSSGSDLHGGRDSGSERPAGDATT